MDNFSLAQIVSAISSYMYGYVLIILLIAAGLYFTFRTKFVQFRLLKESIRVISEPKKDKESISSFHALMVSTASRVGTGNIVGVSGAIIAGGPGAVFWMWIIALVGGASAFIESTLAQIYKKKGIHGSYGGPAYYIEQALGAPFFGGLFAVVLILTYMGGFNALASFNMTDFVQGYFASEKTTMIIGLIVAILSAVVIFGGGKNITKATAVLVPIMAIIYIIVSLVIIVLNITSFPKVIYAIFSEAFNLKSVFGGFLGAAIMNGIKRGLYSNEAGVGSAPNAAASADVSHPVKQGLVQMLSVFIDTIIICSATAFMLLFSGLNGTEYLGQNALFIKDSLAITFGGAGGVFVTISLCLFAYTTLIGNYYYAEMNISYLYKNAQRNKLFIFCFRVLAIVIIFLGSQFESGFAWDLADVLMGIMALINIPVIIILGDKALSALKDYVAQRKEGKNPEFIADNIGIKNTEYWN